MLAVLAATAVNSLVVHGWVLQCRNKA